MKKAANVKQRALISKQPFVSKRFFLNREIYTQLKKICSPQSNFWSSNAHTSRYKDDGVYTLLGCLNGIIWSM